MQRTERVSQVPRKSPRRARILYEERDSSPGSDFVFSDGESPFPKPPHALGRKCSLIRGRDYSPETDSEITDGRMASHIPQRRPSKMRFQHEDRDSSPGSDFVFSDGESPFPKPPHALGRKCSLIRGRDYSPETDSEITDRRMTSHIPQRRPSKMRFQHEDRDSRPSTAFTHSSRRNSSSNPGSRVSSSYTALATRRGTNTDSDYMFSEIRKCATPRQREKLQLAYKRREDSPGSSYSLSDSEAPFESSLHPRFQRSQRSQSARDNQQSPSSHWTDAEDSSPFNPRFPQPWSRPLRRTKEPPKFKGGKSDVQNFLTQFNIVSVYNKWTYTEAGFELASSLEEGARCIINALPQSKQCDYNSLCLALRNQFQHPGRKHKNAIRIWDRTMQKHEDAFSFANALRQMEREAYPGQFLGNDTMKGLFIHGLRDHEMRRYVRRCNPKTFEEAVEIATCDEVYAEAIPTERTWEPCTEMIVKMTREREKPGGSSCSQSKNNRAKRNRMLCYNCRKRGHIAKMCPRSSTHK